MKGKIHTEEAVIPILLRKGLVVKEYDYDEHNNKVLLKEIGIPKHIQCGNKINGKLDFMRIKGWKVVNSEDLTDFSLLRGQMNKKNKSRKIDNDPMKKKTFKRQRKSVNLQSKNGKSWKSQNKK